jgi:hypothetical protein
MPGRPHVSACALLSNLGKRVGATERLRIPDGAAVCAHPHPFQDLPSTCKLIANPDIPQVGVMPHDRNNFGPRAGFAVRGRFRPAAD